MEACVPYDKVVFLYIFSWVFGTFYWFGKKKIWNLNLTNNFKVFSRNFPVIINNSCCTVIFEMISGMKVYKTGNITNIIHFEYSKLRTNFYLRIIRLKKKTVFWGQLVKYNCNSSWKKSMNETIK